MICINCGAKVEKDSTTYIRELGKCIIIIRNVPCSKCSECNEIIYTADVLEKLDKIVDNLKNQITEFVVTDYQMTA